MARCWHTVEQLFTQVTVTVVMIHILKVQENMVSGVPSYKDTVFRKVSDEGDLTLGTTLFGDKDVVWQSHSLAACIVKCLTRYKDTCKFVLYNKTRHQCKPRRQIFADPPAPDGGIIAEADGDLYSATEELTCSSRDDFEQVSYQDGAHHACLKVLPENTYSEQVQKCKSLGGYLIAAKTKEKIERAQRVADVPKFFIGLDDLATEGKFVWHDDSSEMTVTVRKELFQDGEPNNRDGDEDCVSVNDKKLNDISCSNTFKAVCERPLKLKSWKPREG